MLEAGCWGRRACDSKAQRLPFRPALHWPASCPQVAYQGWLPSLENGIITALLAYSKGDSGYEKAFQHLKCFTSIFPVLLKKHGAISSPPIGTLLIWPICQDRAEWAEILNLGNRGGGGTFLSVDPSPSRAWISCLCLGQCFTKEANGYKGETTKDRSLLGASLGKPETPVP